MLRFFGHKKKFAFHPTIKVKKLSWNSCSPCGAAAPYINKNFRWPEAVPMLPCILMSAVHQCLLQSTARCNLWLVALICVFIFLHQWEKERGTMYCTCTVDLRIAYPYPHHFCPLCILRLRSCLEINEKTRVKECTYFADNYTILSHSPFTNEMIGLKIGDLLQSQYEWCHSTVH